MKNMNKHDIESELDKLSKVYERILELEDIRSHIQYVLDFTISDLRTKKRYDELTKEMIKYRRKNIRSSEMADMKAMRIIQEEIEDIRNQFGFGMIDKMNQISGLYNSIYSEDYKKNESNIIKSMKLRRLANKTNNDLEYYYKEYKSLDYLEERLIILYEKLENT